MSWRLIGPAWKVPALTMAERIVLLALVSFTDKAGANAYPSIETLSARCCCSRSTVKRSIAALCKRGLLEATGKGRKGTNRYRVGFTGDTVGVHTGRNVVHPGPSRRSTPDPNPSKHPRDYPSETYPSNALPVDSVFDSGSRRDTGDWTFETVSEQAQRLSRERRQRK